MLDVSHCSVSHGSLIKMFSLIEMEKHKFFTLWYQTFLLLFFSLFTTFAPGEGFVSPVQLLVDANV